ncbi:MAG: AsmA-like C-terminal domain-containing protein [Alphaproteobacteria bacterium]|nr:AsmA-like C-terminal domain-containing protein [Alphaproteobacteria bacterium]
MKRFHFAIRLLEWIGAIVGGLAVIAMLLLWRLSTGPIELDFARAYTAQSFDTSEGRMKMQARRVSLVWGGWQQPVQLVLADIAAIDAQGVQVATVPAVVINLSLRALAGGVLQPTEIDIDNIRLDVVITREGLIETLLPQEADASSSRILPILMEQLLRPPDLKHPLGRLNQVRIGAARVRVDDKTTGFVWDAPAARAVMARDRAGVRMQGTLSMQAGGETAEFQMSALYGRSREQLDISLRGRNLRLAAFATAAPQLAPLAELNLPLEGVIRLSASGKGEIRNVSVDLAGGSGRVGIPGVLSPARDVDKVALRLSFTPSENRVQVEEFSVGFRGPTARLSGVLELTARTFRFDGNAEVRDIPIARLAEFWLEPLATGGRTWALANIADGALTAASLDFVVAGDFDRPEDLKVERSVARLRYEGLTVTYLDPLPPLRGVSGTATFDGTVMRFDIVSGNADNLRLAGARVDILGLEKPNNHRTEMELRIEASVADALAFLAHPKIGLSKDLLFDPKRTSGDVALALRMKFPLLKTLPMSDVEYAATADIERFSLQNAAFGLALSDATARVEVDSRELSVSGRGKVDGQVLDVQWREMFGPKVPFRRRYEVKGQVSQAILAKAGLASLAPYLSGNIMLAPLVYQVPAAGPSELSLKADLKPARIVVSELMWEKPAGTDGQASLTARFAGGPAPAVTDFDLRLGDLSAAGKLELKPADGALQRVAFSRLALGRTTVAGDLRRTATGYALDIKGAALDIARFLEDEKKAPRPDPGAPAPPLGGPVVVVSLDVGQLLLKRGALPSVRGTVTRQGDRTLSADLQLTAGTAGPTRLTIAGDGTGRQLTLKSPDAGSLLQAAGWLDGLVGGDLDIGVRIDDSKADPPMTGRVEMRKFRIATTPPVAGRDVGTLNGVVEQLDKAGNASQMFDKLEARIEKTGGRLVIRGGQASGNSVGITAQGTYDLDREEICLGGAVTPAYVLNAFLSNIPIIGWILTGGEGRGLFAINYSVRGPIDNPKGEVDGATAITPGFLRRMMEGTCGISGGGSEGSGGRGPERTLEERQQERIGQ